MSTRLARRDFLKAAPAAAGVLAYAIRGDETVAGAADQTPKPAPKPADVRIGTTTYQPIQDYPIRPKRHTEVTLTDDFWRPKVATNAEVTIPFEVKKLSEGGRGFGGGVLEAAILSLAGASGSDAAGAGRRARAHDGAGARRRQRRFEIAATYFTMTGKRDLLDRRSNADALYENFKTNNPPFSGGERDAINCVQLYRATHDKKHLDLAKHYLDIRGLENSVNRSRHNQSYKPVLEQSEAVGHAVNCVR